jgi:hypothetical protein
MLAPITQVSASICSVSSAPETLPSGRLPNVDGDWLLIGHWLQSNGGNVEEFAELRIPRFVSGLHPLITNIPTKTHQLFINFL